ncbi:MAG TPA: hypothetical protein DFR83_18730, partial [Deltaproteobacteria bacterium]|nr:hypothetical protein [Deltaproteobacteria bacterium]
MRPFRLLLIALALPMASPSVTEAARNRTAARAEAAPGSAPAIVPAEGSLWDFIEDVEGTIPVGEVVPESEELAEERQEEARFIAALSAADA